MYLVEQNRTRTRCRQAGRLIAMLAVLMPFAQGAAQPSAVAAAQPSVVYDSGNPTAAEQYQLELINRARANPVAEATAFGIGLNEGLLTIIISSDPKPP